ncbi:isoleucyl-trna synthetase [Phaffia rhodozyma]|uniref:isoleucine--tRNA ligase n=1 Tax=Phaffia rhodozyma TaxID=264483 RepID=A0A0F7SEW6_PHARH|nr:isoleucyl-trna synthetase [Phaffia rhodozyma]
MFLSAARTNVPARFISHQCLIRSPASLLSSRCLSLSFPRSAKEQKESEERLPESTLTTEQSTKPHTTTDSKKYASTLILPKTTFPQRPNVKTLRETFGEKTMGGLYRWQREHNKGGKEFVFLDGPPYANGNLHMGHSLNRILKDITNRHEVLEGSRVNYVPGWDCHGLPIENKALKKLDKDFHDLAPSEIRSAAKSLAEECVQLQRGEMEMLGVMADWSKEGTYRTLDHEYEIRQLKIFKMMVENGLIKTHHRPSYYSPSSRTALAEAELKYVEDHVSLSAYIKLNLAQAGSKLEKVLEDNQIENQNDISLLIWTTTPWSMASNMAVMVNTNMDYALVRYKSTGQLLIAAQDRLGDLTKDLGDSNSSTVEGVFEKLATFNGADLLDTTYQPVFVNTPSSDNASSNPSLLRIIASSHVTSTVGTGLVHCAPAHGLEDFVTFKEHAATGGLSHPKDLVCPIDADGKFTDDVLEDRLVGKAVLEEGNEIMVDVLKDRGLLLKAKKYTHKYPYDWKTKKPVLIRFVFFCPYVADATAILFKISHRYLTLLHLASGYRSSSQWFANLEKVKDFALKSLSDVEFVPASSRNRLQAFIKSRSEWCISRQRTWGVPIPALYDESTDEAILNSESVSHIIDVLSEKGLSHWWDAPVDVFLTPALRESGKTYRKGTDTMDVWFDSGSAWTNVADRSSSGHVADVVLEGSDQHRGWFQSLLLTYLSADAKVMNGESKPVAPYKTIITHGMVLDDSMEKMSKSDGNVISPVSILDGTAFATNGNKSKLGPQGADVLRLCAAATDYTTDLSIGKSSIEKASSQLQRFRVLLKFCVGNLRADTQPISSFHRDDLSVIDRYVLHSLWKYCHSTRSSYTAFSYHQVVEKTILLLNDLSSVYFDAVKDTVYADLPEEMNRQIHLSVLKEVVNVVSQELGPILPYLIEELHSHRPDIKNTDRSFFEQRRQRPEESWKDEEAESEIEALIEIRKAVRTLIDTGKKEEKLSSSLEAHLEFTSAPNGSFQKILQKNRDILARLFAVSHVTLMAQPIDEPQSWEYSKTITSDSEERTSTTELYVRIFPSSMHKCPRCWVYSAPRENMLLET